jgi:membrane-associated phospholipid phosphatase
MNSRLTIAPVVCIAVLCANKACAAPPDSLVQRRSHPENVLECDGRAFLHITGEIFSAPAHWKGSQWLTFGGIGGGIAGSALLDNDASSLVHRNRSRFNDNLTNYTVQYGDGLNMLLVSAGGYVAGLACKSSWLRETSLLTGSSIVIAGTISTITKVIVGRARPYTGRGHGFFKPFTFNDESFFSFPSGHAVVAFAVSGVLSERINNLWASIGLYTLAAGTAYARVYTDHHWFSDVVAGAALSIAVSGSVVRIYEGRSSCERDTGLRLVPAPDGITLAWVF